MRYAALLLLLGVTWAEAQSPNPIRDLEKAARKGSVGAQYKLGMAYADAYKVKRDYAKAVEWLTKAGEQGNVHAQEFLGKLYFTGNGMEQSYELAAHWLVRSAELGNPEA